MRVEHEVLRNIIPVTDSQEPSASFYFPCIRVHQNSSTREHLYTQLRFLLKRYQPLSEIWKEENQTRQRRELVEHPCSSWPEDILEQNSGGGMKTDPGSVVKVPF